MSASDRVAFFMTLVVILLLDAYFLRIDIVIAPLLPLFLIGIAALFAAVAPAKGSIPRGYFAILSLVSITVSLEFAFGGVR